MSRRTWLVSASIAAHLAVGVGMFATGVWRLERLESDHRLAGIAVMAPPAPSGSPAELPAPQFKPKQQRKVVKEPVQPVKPPPDVVASAEVPTATPGNGQGSGTGDGVGADGDASDTGTCTTPPCGPAAAPQPPITPPQRVVAPVDVPPTVLQQLRISGQTQLHPPAVTKTEMLHAGRTRSVGMFKVCIAASGGVASVTVLKSTAYPAFDATLLAGIRGWRYRPYLVNGTPTPVCGAVSFVYVIK
ncbi:MAG: TonB family protein [Myxococcota bacterium]|nr:TonB family protein [Myxococcota bacterium]